MLKALRKEPQRRYASVQEFSEDIRRHLEGLPVMASPDTFGYRARKFVRRHTTAVVAAAIVIITLLSATGITAWQTRVARRERDKAQSRFNDVRKLANSLVFELHDSIQNLPGSTPSRELLVSRALEYLDKLAKEAGQERPLQLELAAAYDKIGDIQGGYATSHLGKRQQADESYRKALAIREALVTAEPNNLDFRRKLATSYTKMAQISWAETDVAGSLDFYQKALEINKVLVSEAPDQTEIRLDLATSYSYFGLVLAATGRVDEGLDSARRAVALMEELALSDPTNTRVQRELGNCYSRVADILDGAQQNYAEALVLYRKSNEISERLLRGEPLNTKLRRSHAVTLFDMSTMSAKLGDTRTALDSSRRAVSILKDMLAADPQNQDLRETVAAVQTGVCGIMIKTGNADEAIKLLNETLLILEKSFAASPTDEILHFRIAVVEQQMGNGYASLASDEGTGTHRLAHWREARSWFKKSQAIYKTFGDAGKLTGEDAARLDAVIEGIAKCDATIVRLTGK